jgi:hypothetical protein
LSRKEVEYGGVKGNKHMINTLTLKEAIQLAPSVGSSRASDKTSSTYQFVSTRNILEKVEDLGWRITGVSAQGRSPYAQHRVTLVHEKDLNGLVDGGNEEDGLLRIELFNSHNLSRRFMMAMGYFRFACSNGLIVATGPAESIRTKHRFSDGRMESIMEQIESVSERFPRILNTIKDFKSRQLNEQEQRDFAEYAIKGRYLYRQALPKTFSNLDRMTERMLTCRRVEDEGNSAWEIYNRVQENIVKGIDGVTRPMLGYGDNVRVNQLLWKGAESTLEYSKNRLKDHLLSMLVKNRKKEKVSL